MKYLYNNNHQFWPARLLPALLTCGLMFCTTALVCAQDSDFKIVGHHLNTELRRIELHVKALRNGVSIALKQDEPVFTETIDGKSLAITVDSIAHKVVENKSTERFRDTLNVLFLVGAGAGYTPEMKAQRRGLIEKIVQELGTGASSSNFFIGQYGDYVTQPQMADPSQLESILTGYDERQDVYSELYSGIVEATRFSRERKGKWVIFIFTDGINKENSAQYTVQAPYNEADVLYFLSKLGLSTFIVPIGVGNVHDTAIFQKLIRATGNPADTFAIGAIPGGLQDQIARKVDIAYNNVVFLYPNNTIFRGEKRTYAGKWLGGPEGHKEAEYSFSEGTQQNPKPLAGDLTGTEWFINWIFGLLMVGGTLGFLAVAIPYAGQRKFLKNYVKRYRKEAGVMKSDPLTGEPFNEGDLVVVKCPRQTTSLETWNYVGHKCPNYPKCLDYANPCDGAGAPADTDSFFRGKGLFRRLNWVWFGMVGGFIAWSLFALFKYMGLEWYNALLYQFYGAGFGDGTQTESYVASIADDTLLGAAFGAGICFTLSWAEERSQPRKMSWLRVALRTFIGLIVSLLVFFLGFYLQYTGFVSNLTASGLITWLLFGLAVGIVLSVESSVSWWRGLLGGLAAALLAYGLFVLLGAFGSKDFALAKLFSFILMGGLLGFTMVTVLTRLEDFELEYISPELFRQVNPISKWLKNGTDVFIGREQGNYVYVKWEDDAVEPYHARLFYDKGVVYIEPLAETLVNGRMLELKANTPLRNGDIIQLGRMSNTRMRYREKRKVADEGTGYPNSRATASPHDGKGSDGKFRINMK